MSFAFDFLDIWTNFGKKVMWKIFYSNTITGVFKILHDNHCDTWSSAKDIMLTRCFLFANMH